MPGGTATSSIHTYTDATFKRKAQEEKDERRALRAEVGEMKDEVSAIKPAHPPDACMHACAHACMCALTYMCARAYTCTTRCMQVSAIKASVDQMQAMLAKLSCDPSQASQTPSK